MGWNGVPGRKRRVVFTSSARKASLSHLRRNRSASLAGLRARNAIHAAAYMCNVTVLVIQTPGCMRSLVVAPFGPSIKPPSIKYQAGIRLHWWRIWTDTLFQSSSDMPHFILGTKLKKEGDFLHQIWMHGSDNPCFEIVVHKGLQRIIKFKAKGLIKWR